MEILAGFVLGMFTLPWLWLLAVSILCIVDVVLCENDAFGWATALLIGGVGLVAWLGGDVNVLSWTWANLAGLVKLFIGYLLVGSLWSIVKWYFYLLKIRDRVKESSHDKNTRPVDTYARYNMDKLIGWIGHWPFSMIGSLFGDVLTRIVTSIYRVLSGLYDRVANSVFAGFEEEK